MGETESYYTDIALIQKDVAYMRERMKEIHEVLTKNGLITTVALNKRSIKLLVGWMTIISGSIAGIFWRVFG